MNRKTATLSFLVLCLLTAPTSALAWDTLAEDFTGRGLVDTNWILSGDARLTGGVEDPEGDGWLRLTGAQSNERAWAYYDVPIPTDQGIVVVFDLAAWGGIGADGVTAFLFDGSVGGPAAPAFRVGGWGGSLGYAQRCTADGMRGAYVGVGFDEYGNFSNSGECRAGGLGGGLFPDSIAIRGGEAAGFPFLTGTGQLPVNIDCPRGSCPTRPNLLGDGLHTIRLAIIPDGGTFSISVSMRSSPDAPYVEVIPPFTLPDAPPATLKFGWTGSTGNSHNVHEIRRLRIYEPANEPPDVDPTLDTDGDGLTDLDEFTLGTLPDDPDSDGDGLEDGAEIHADNPNPTDPMDPDSDDDGIRDDVEVQGDNPTDPNDPDSDDDGLCDGPVEFAPDCVAGEDLDADGQVDPDETDPMDPDSDDGGVDDGEERLARGSDPLDGADDEPAPATDPGTPRDPIQVDPDPQPEVPADTPDPELPDEDPTDPPADGPGLDDDALLTYAGNGCAQAGGSAPSPSSLLALGLLGMAWARRRRRRAAGLAGAALATLAAAPTAHAQSIDAEVGVSRTRIDQRRDINEVATTDLLGHTRVSLAVGASYAHRPLSLQLDGAQVSDVVAGRLSPHVGASIGLLGALQLSAELPMVAYQAGRDLDDDLSARPDLTGPALGDARLEARWRALAPADTGGFGLALALGARAPTGEVATLNSDGAWRPEATLIGDWRHPFDGVRVALNVGVLGRADADVRGLFLDDELTLAAAVESTVGLPDVRARASIAASRPLSRLSSDQGAEASLGLTWAATSELLVAGRLGFGLGQAPGIPTARAGLSLTWSPGLVADEPLLAAAEDVPPPPPAPAPPAPREVIVVSRLAPPAPLPIAPLTAPAPAPRAAPAEPAPTAPRFCRASNDAIDLDERIFFEHDSATLTPRSAAMLASLAARLEARPDLGRVVVEGHTSAAGSAPYNENLSLERARAVAIALIESGLSPERVDARAWGERRPLRAKDDPLAPTLNRRVEVHVQHALLLEHCDGIQALLNR
jgi:MYXO-CTERM domain-containing protein